METDDRFFLPRLQPEITGNPTIVFIDAPIRDYPDKVIRQSEMVIRKLRESDGK